MAKDLVIVESPAKARTVQRFLGSGFVAKASMGHVRDLPKSKMGVEIEEDFKPTYRVLNDKRKVVSELSAEARRADTVYLATDPDREGEAISWHLIEAAKIPLGKAKRVVFHEITREAISDAFAHPREMDRSLIDAQQARRVLDRVVGYRLSPVLWRKVRRGLSAGRVQSVALRLVVDREAEIDAFIPQEFWTIDAMLSKRPRMGAAGEFTARLRSVEGVKGRLEIPNQEASDGIVADLKGAEYAVASVRTRETRSRPAAPFITSTLQQEAARKLRFTARRTMRVAQQLYEGLSIGDEGQVGLITYMRTDSTNVAAQALAETAALIRAQVRRGVRPRQAASVHAQGEGRAGSARGGAPDVRLARAGRHTPLSERRAVSAVRPHLEAHGRQPDERRAVRFHERRHIRRRRLQRARVRIQGAGFGSQIRRVPRGIYGGEGRRRRRGFLRRAADPALGEGARRSTA